MAVKTPCCNSVWCFPNPRKLFRYKICITQNEKYPMISLTNYCLKNVWELLKKKINTNKAMVTVSSFFCNLLVMMDQWLNVVIDALQAVMNFFLTWCMANGGCRNKTVIAAFLTLEFGNIPEMQSFLFLLSFFFCLLFPPHCYYTFLWKFNKCPTKNLDSQSTE